MPLGCYNCGNLQPDEELTCRACGYRSQARAYQSNSIGGVVVLADA